MNATRLPRLLFLGAACAALSLTAQAAGAPAGLLAFYDFEGDAGDRSGNGHDATFVNATLGQGYEGQAYHFDGIDDYIRLPLDINPTALPQVTFGAWVWMDRASAPDNFNSTQTFISHDNGGFDRTLDQDPRAGGGNQSSTFTGSGGVLGGAPVVTGEWVFIAARYDQAARTVWLNVGDTQVDRSNVTLGAGWSFTDLGNNPSYRSYLQGRIDNVFFYDRVLGDDELTAIRIGGAQAILPAVPEPATALLWTGGALGLLACGRRRRAS